MSNDIPIIARLGRHESRPERLALLRPDGSVSSWLACDETREQVAAVLAAAGLTLCDDDTIICVRPP